MVWFTDTKLKLFTAKSQSSNDRNEYVIHNREAWISLYRSKSHPRLIIIPYLWAFSLTWVFAIKYTEVPKSDLMSWMHLRIRRTKAQYLYGYIENEISSIYERLFCSVECHNIWKIVLSLWRSQYSKCDNKMTRTRLTVIVSSNSNPNGNWSNRLGSERKKAIFLCLTCRIVSYLSPNKLMVNGAINSLWPSEAKESTEPMMIYL